MGDVDAQEMADSERIFKRFYTNEDEMISAAELGEPLKTLGNVSGEEVNSIKAEIDTDDDNNISYQDYIYFANANCGLMKDVAKIF